MKREKKPLIGICNAGLEEIVKKKQAAYSNLKDRYLEAVIMAGGIPLILPAVAPEDTQAQLTVIDGLILAGGGDINPLLFGEEPIPEMGVFYQERDDHEIAAVKAAYRLNKPILAICRGIQLLNVALGGTLYQDVPSQTTNRIKHSQECPNGTGSHSVFCEPRTRLHALLGDKYVVNSLHHEAIKDLADNLSVTCRDPEGLIEGVESKTQDFVVGVQWHPELLVSDHEPMRNLFKVFVEHSCRISS